jgi:hypothetical protein
LIEVVRDGGRWEGEGKGVEKLGKRNVLSI